MITTKKHIRRTLLFILCLLTPVFSQEIGLPFVRVYSPEEYDNTPQVWGAIQGNDGLMYFGMTNGGGIAEYDGNEWRVIDIPNNTTVFSFVKDSSGMIYAGAINDFGYLHDDSLGKKEFVSLRHLIPDQAMKFRAVWETILLGNDVYFMSVEAIFKYSPLPTPSIHTYLPGNGSGFMGIFSYDGNVYVHQKRRGLVRLEQDSVALVSDFYNGKMFRYGIPVGTDSIFIPTRSAGTFMFRPSTRTSIPFIIHTTSARKNLDIYAATLLPNRSIALSTFGNGVYVVSPDGSMAHQWNEDNILPTNAVYTMKDVGNDILWLMTENGIVRTNGSTAWSYWNKKNGLHGTVTCILRFNGRLYVTTYAGVFVLSAQNSMKRVSGIPAGQCFSLLDFAAGKGRHVLLAGTPGGIYEIDGSSSRLVRKGYYGLTMYQSHMDPHRLFIVDDPTLVAMRYEGGRWKDEGTLSGVRDNIRGIIEDSVGDLWLGTYNAGIIRITTQKNNIVTPKAVRYYTQKDGLPSLRTVYPTMIDGEIVFSTQKGLYIYDHTVDAFKPYKKLDSLFSAGKQDIEVITETYDSSIVVLPLSNKSDDAGILQRQSNGDYQWTYKPFRGFGRMEFHTAYMDSDNVLWIGTSGGLLRYDRNMDKMKYDAGFTALIRKVILNNDSIVSYGQNVSKAIVSYAYNDVRFEVAAPFFNDESKTHFSYQLKGYDTGWKKWTSNHYAVYTNLNEGTYTFRAKAKNMYDTESNIAEFTLTIQPPWFRTGWAHLAYILCIVSFVLTFDRWNKKRLKGINDRQYEEERRQQQQFTKMLIERQEEERKRIAREMHDGLGQDLLILKHQLEVKMRDRSIPGDVKQLLEGQSATTSNIITEVRTISHNLRPPELDRLGVTETIRAVLQRIRNTKQITVKGTIDEIDGFFRKDDEINIIRIIQEAMHNIMKHADAKTATVILTHSDTGVNLSIADNGKGMGPDAGGSHGLGMNDIRERVQLLNGTMSVESSMGNGTTLNFHFPKTQSDRNSM